MESGERSKETDHHVEVVRSVEDDESRKGRAKVANAMFNEEPSWAKLQRRPLMPFAFGDER
jgi:hypothetical protein